MDKLSGGPTQILGLVVAMLLLFICRASLKAGMKVLSGRCTEWALRQPSTSCWHRLATCMMSDKQRQKRREAGEEEFGLLSDADDAGGDEERAQGKGKDKGQFTVCVVWLKATAGHELGMVCMGRHESTQTLLDRCAPLLAMRSEALGELDLLACRPGQRAEEHLYFPLARESRALPAARFFAAGHIAVLRPAAVEKGVQPPAPVAAVQQASDGGGDLTFKKDKDKDKDGKRERKERKREEKMALRTDGTAGF